MTRFLKIFFLGLAGSTLLLGGCNKRGEFSPVDMWNRSRIKPLEPIGFFPDGSSSQQIPPGTVYRGQTERDKLFPTGDNGQTMRQMQDANNVTDNPTTPASGGAAGLGAVRTGIGIGGAGAASASDTMGPTGDYRVRGAGASMTKFPFPITKKVLQRGKERYEIYCAPCHGRTGAGDGMIVRRGFSQPPTYHQERLRKAPVGHYFDVITNGYGAMYPYADKVSPEDRWAITAYIRALQLSQNAKISDVPANERANIGKPKPRASTPAHGDTGMAAEPTRPDSGGHSGGTND